MSIFGATQPPITTDRLGIQGRERFTDAVVGQFLWLTRPRRVLLLLAAVWVINLFDLRYTLSESLHSAFHELNPLAASLLSRDPDLLIYYKFGLLFSSSVILLICRMTKVAELGCWVLLAAYSCVAVRWWSYFEQRIAAYADPAVNTDPILGCICP